MLYRVNADLPPAVKADLPDDAQDIFREAFNSAFAQLAGERDRERRAQMIAWSAVKLAYEKAADDQWIERELPTH